MHTSVTTVSTDRAVAARYLSCLRVPEILLLQGPPLLGLALAVRHPAAGLLPALALLVAAGLCLMAHVFLLNDWAGITADLADPHKAAGAFTAKGVGRSEIGWLSAVALALALFLFSLLGPIPFCLCLSIAALSALYSLPQFDWKGRPFFGTAAHLAGGTLHFLLGYSVGAALDGRAFAIATFFALTFAAGHLNQELRDYEGDARSGVRTSAVTFRPRRAFFASLFLFTLAHADLLSMSLRGTLPLPLAGLAALYPIHLFWSFQALAQGLSWSSICRLQARYRALYAIIGLVMVAGALWAKP